MAFKYAIVLTGSISTGKSTVANFFSSDGFSIIDADKIAHQVLDEQHKVIAQMFGRKLIKDNMIDRKELGSIVFKDNEKREELEALLHPLIYDKIKQLSKEEDKFKKPYFIDIPLFFEGDRYSIDKSLVIYTTKETQLKRLMQRDKHNRKEALSRIEIQMDIEEKRKLATYAIDNSGDLSELREEYERVKQEILGDFK